MPPRRRPGRRHVRPLPGAEVESPDRPAGRAEYAIGPGSLRDAVSAGAMASDPHRSDNPSTRRAGSRTKSLSPPAQTMSTAIGETVEGLAVRSKIERCHQTARWPPGRARCRGSGNAGFSVSALEIHLVISRVAKAGRRAENGYAPAASHCPLRQDRARADRPGTEWPSASVHQRPKPLKLGRSGAVAALYVA